MKKLLISSLVAASTLVYAFQANAATILFAQVQSGVYVNDGNQISSFLSNAGHSVTNRFLDAAVYNDYSSFDQVWVYDLATGPNNNAIQAANYANIASWFNGFNADQQNLIADGRIISSGPNWTSGGEPEWIQNYASQLQSRDGARLVLGTDHGGSNQCSGVFVDGINEINAAINIDPFCGIYFQPPLLAEVDPASPLYLAGLDSCSFDPAKKCINDNSSTSFAPAGAQSAGFTLTPVAYHGGTSTAFTNAAVSATFGSRTFGTCGGAGQPACAVGEPASIASFGLGFMAIALGLTARRRKIR